MSPRGKRFTPTSEGATSPRAHSYFNMAPPENSETVVPTPPDLGPLARGKNPTDDLRLFL